MTFYVQGLNSHEEMSLSHLFNQYRVAKTHESAPTNHADIKKQNQNVSQHPFDDTQKRAHSGIAVQSYQEIKQLPKNIPVLLASQIMITPVISIRSYNSIEDAMKLFQTLQLRHIPVVTEKGIVVGIISERDVFRHLSGVSENYEQKKTSARVNDHVKKLMKTDLLTASIDTDVRYIARLFVERRVGAMPIVIEGNLKGIITRSDILNAVMRNFNLELWI